MLLHFTHVSAVSSILRLMQVKPTLVFFFLPIGLVVSIGDWPWKIPRRWAKRMPSKKWLYDRITNCLRFFFQKFMGFAEVFFFLNSYQQQLVLRYQQQLVLKVAKCGFCTDLFRILYKWCAHSRKIRESLLSKRLFKEGECVVRPSWVLHIFYLGNASVELRCVSLRWISRTLSYSF